MLRRSLMVMTRRGGDGGTLPLTFISMFTCDPAPQTNNVKRKYLIKALCTFRMSSFFFFHILELTVNVITHLEIPGHKER